MASAYRILGFKAAIPMTLTLRLFAPHPNLNDIVNCRVIHSEIEGGVFLADLPPATVLKIQKQHHDYMAVTLSANSVLISGHPEYCPEPVLVAIAGST
jgi:hypothetical protein